MEAETDFKGRQFGSYTCVRRLGVGGMGETFLAVRRGEHGFEQRVCIKTIHPAYRESPDFVRLFFQEATIAASLRHSNIVSVIDASHDEGYMVLELVDGLDLRTLLREQPSRRLPPALVTWVMLELCRALEYAHNRTLRGRPDGIVHRDVSPSNILVSYAGEVKLTDFGIAKAMSASGGEASTLKGKVVYMAPEQITGAPVDGRTDLFSAGVTVYELLTGRRPFDGDNDAATLKRITLGECVPLSEQAPFLPAGLTGVVDRLLAVDPKDRFQSATEVIDALARFSPSLAAYRGLGELARKAKPHVTLFTSDVSDSGEPQEESRSADASSPPRDSAEAGDTEKLAAEGAHDEPELAAGQSASVAAATATRTAVEAVQAAAAEAPVARDAGSADRVTNERRGRRVAAVLGAAALAFAGLGAVLLSSSGDDDSAAKTATDSLPEPAAAAKSPAVTEGRPGEAATSAPESSPTDDRVEIALPQPSPTGPTDEPRDEPVEPATGPPVEPGAPASAEASQRPASPAANRRPRGKLQIGVFPAGKVWVDGRARGRAPITVSVSAGTHTVAAGHDQPAESRSVRVSAGKTEEVVFNIRATGGESSR